MRTQEHESTRTQDYQRRAGEIGLYDYHARWYDPALGRFIQADTLAPQPGNSLAWDRYGYALNAPLRFTDPSGNWMLV